MLLDMQSWRQNHWLNMWLTEVDLSIRTKRRLQQDAKSNNVAHDDEQHNAALRRWNHEEKKTRKHLIYVEITYLERKKGKKTQRGDSRSKNYLKPPLFDEWKRKKLREKLKFFAQLFDNATYNRRAMNNWYLFWDGWSSGGARNFIEPVQNFDSHNLNF